MPVPHPALRSVVTHPCAGLGILALVFATACGSPAPEPAPTPEDDAAEAQACAAEAASACRRTQRGCALDDAGAPVCASCPAGHAPRADGACEAIAGTVHAHDFGAVDVQGGEEIADLCQSWTLDNAEELWVNAVELDNDGLYHHSNWFFVPDDRFAVPDGNWGCAAHDFSEVDAALAGGVLYAQSTQARREVQRFAPGVAVRIPPYARIVSSTHLLNTTSAPASTGLRLRIYTLPREQVQVKLTPFRLGYADLEIQPRATSSFEGRCNLDEKHQQLFSAPLALKLHYVLPHTHALGRRMELWIEGGPRAGEAIFAADTANGEANGYAFDPPIDLAGATGFGFRCTFENPRDVQVGWGIGDQEMCELLAYAETDMLSDSWVNAGALVSAEGGTHAFGGPCEVIAFPMDHDKAGGPAR